MFCIRIRAVLERIIKSDYVAVLGPLARRGSALVGLIMPLLLVGKNKNLCRTPFPSGTALLAKGWGIGPKVMEGMGRGKQTPDLSVLFGKTQHHNIRAIILPLLFCQYWCHFDLCYWALSLLRTPLHWIAVGRNLPDPP